MAMTLRLTDDETVLLREQAQREGRSMQEVARESIREYVQRRQHVDDRDAAMRAGATRYADLLRRLGE
jgi:predicted transcriptional regulator